MASSASARSPISCVTAKVMLPRRAFPLDKSAPRGIVTAELVVQEKR